MIQHQKNQVARMIDMQPRVQEQLSEKNKTKQKKKKQEVTESFSKQQQTPTRPAYLIDNA